MSDGAQDATIKTRIPARLDRLPWSKFHWLVIIGLGTVWILDGLEVTLVGSLAGRLTEKGSGIDINAAQIGVAAAFYVAGACFGALFFGQLTDRFGRKKLFMVSLGLYLIATTATAFSFAPWYFFAARFVTGAGIGGEYAAINSAIDELIPARVRGRVDLIINGSYWFGAAAGSLVSVFFLNTAIFGQDVGWRLAFGMGLVLGMLILVVRRNVPESPRWLFIHGREEEAERIVDGIEENVEEETNEKLSQPEDEIEVRQRERIPFRTIARTAFRTYPKRSILGLALFVGQAFLYNAVTFDLGTLIGDFFKIDSGKIPYFFAIFAVGNLLGPLTMGRLFDTVGRKPMIAFSYLGSSVVLAVTGILFAGGSLTITTFMILIGVTFFLASSGASAAYLTVSEIFPMETRALAIAFFYAVGTAAGGISGPLLFGHLIDSGNAGTVAIGFYIGCVTMAIGGVAELLFGVNAEGEQLEAIAKPLTAQDAEDGDDDAGANASSDSGTEDIDSPERQAARERTARAAERVRRQRELDRTGLRRYRPGPGRLSSSPGMSASSPLPAQSLDREIEMIERALDEQGPSQREELARAVGARFWGPGVFRQALREGQLTGELKRVGRRTYATSSADHRGGDT